ncbi:MAG: SDR family NAD(P)-dependent oxidoreductase [Gammaproteobacteria bacterium]|nr:SDR family NAD(P)-dependent oxidoreductase [Gammaproteobacteria bacterium]
MELKDKVVVVTGAGRGLGQKMSQMIAAKGARLVLVGLTEKGLKETVQLCSKAGGQADYYITDVSDEAAVEQLFGRIIPDHGRVDALINNAGITRDGLLVKAKNGKITDKMSLDDWDAGLSGYRSPRGYR